MANQTVYRSSHKRNYTVIGNQLVSSADLSWKAKGILIYLLSKPEDWVTRLDDIVKHSTDGRASVLSGLKELKQKGYLEKVRITDQKTGQVTHWETIVHESPIATSPDVENRHSGNPDSGNPQSGKSNPTKYGSIQNTHLQKIHTQTGDDAIASGVCVNGDDFSFSDLTGGEIDPPSTTGQVDQEPLEPGAGRSRKSNNQIHEFVEWANSAGHWSLKVTKTLAKVAEGKAWDELRSALEAMCEQYESEEGLKHEQRYFTKAVSEGWAASEEWHERKREQRRWREEEERRVREAKRVRGALEQMQAAGQVTVIEHTGDWYSYRLPGDETGYNANAWDLPKGFVWDEDAA